MAAARGLRRRNLVATHASHEGLDHVDPLRTITYPSALCTHHAHCEGFKAPAVPRGVFSDTTHHRVRERLPRKIIYMAHLYRDLSVKSLYTDRKYNGGQRGWQQQIEQSTTLYIGNLSFYTTEEQLYALFGRVGEVRRIIMGLDRNTKTPCGFCFVEYHRRTDTEDAIRYIGGCKLDDRIVRVDWDGGFVEGRQYGRGRSGGQVREEYRTDYDAGRGGWGKAVEGASPALEPMGGGRGGLSMGGQSVLPQPRCVAARALRYAYVLHIPPPPASLSKCCRLRTPDAPCASALLLLGRRQSIPGSMQQQQRSMIGGQAANERSGGRAGDGPSADDDERSSKRSRQEANPRFREANKDDDDDD